MLFEDSEEEENTQEVDDGFEDDEEADKELKNEEEDEWSVERPGGEDRGKMREVNGRQGPWRFELDEEDSDLRREDQDWGKMSRQDGSFGKIKMELK